MTNHGLLVYPMLDGRFNVGDYVQSIAAKRFLPRVDHSIDRERLAQCNAPAGTRLILNGWFTHEPRTWPPAPSLEPLVTSFHINESVRQTFTGPESIAWLKSMEPIGCRDRNTLEMLKNQGVDAYFSACLTLTLDRCAFCTDTARRGVFLVDPVPALRPWSTVLSGAREFARALKHGRLADPARLRRCLLRILDSELLDGSIWIEHELPAVGKNHKVRFELARERLMRYASAELVVTSRIHCALPCLAFGTPVIFLNSAAGDNISECRFDGLLELLNVADVNHDTLDVTTRFGAGLPLGRSEIPVNPSRHLELAATLERICRTFVETGRREGP